MQLRKSAMSGTLESSDAMVTLEPGGEGIRVEITSIVKAQYGRQIEACVRETLERLGVDNVKAIVVDKGALECTLKARVESAAFRAAEIDSGFPWGGAIK
ncbi:MAG: citrate lyase acyl carrier protein [Clostridiaceae bacterium]|jgi:citrate lyase subunit gamma (acyl carrier protein)|nr:citrate lyase acyl carrier protein [Clostridiaceae bacterium]